MMNAVQVEWSDEALTDRAAIDNTREWIAAYPYVLLYEVDDILKVVRILRLWHLSQNRDSM